MRTTHSPHSLPALRRIALSAALACLAPAALAQSADQAPTSTTGGAFWQDVTVATPVAVSSKFAAAASSQAQVASAREAALSLNRFHAAALDLAGMRAFGAGAPKARNAVSVAREPNTLTISLPHPDGNFQRFTLVETPIMEPGLAARHPEIKTYRGVGIDDPRALLSMDITPLGLHASVRSPNGGYYVDPYYRNDTSVYASYGRADLANQHGALREGANDDAQLSLSRSFYGQNDAIDVHGTGFAPGAGVTVEVRADGDAAPVGTFSATADQNGAIELTLPAGSVGTGSYDVSASDGAKGSDALFQVLDAAAATSAANNSSGTQLRSYRVALVSDPSYATYFGANNVTAAKVTLMNRVSQVYETETSIRLVLIDATDALNLATVAQMTGANGPCGGSACFTTNQASGLCQQHAVAQPHRRGPAGRCLELRPGPPGARPERWRHRQPGRGRRQRQGAGLHRHSDAGGRLLRGRLRGARDGPPVQRQPPVQRRGQQLRQRQPQRRHLGGTGQRLVGDGLRRHLRHRQPADAQRSVLVAAQLRRDHQLHLERRNEFGRSADGRADGLFDRWPGFPGRLQRRTVAADRAWRELHGRRHQGGNRSDPGLAVRRHGDRSGPDRHRVQRHLRRHARQRQDVAAGAGQLQQLQRLPSARSPSAARPRATAPRPPPATTRRSSPPPQATRSRCARRSR